MKKIIVFLFASVLFLLSSYDSKVYIPKESIRYRIIASSDSKEDILNKWNINYELIPYLDNILKDSNNIDETRNLLKNNINNISEFTSKYTNDFSIKYGLNYFPQKEYKDVIYNEGYYESLVITLGDGQGDNFWCVLFPPLCLMDNTSKEIEYKSYVKTIINKYL